MSGDLLQKIERKDRVFRILQAVFFALISIGLAVLIYLSYHLQLENHKLLDNQTALLSTQKAAVAELEQNTTEQLSLQTRYIQCLARLLSLQTNHSSLTLDDLNTCTISVTASGATLPTPETSRSPTAASTIPTPRVMPVAAPKPSEAPQSSSGSSPVASPVATLAPPGQPTLFQVIVSTLSGLL